MLHPFSPSYCGPYRAVCTIILSPKAEEKNITVAEKMSCFIPLYHKTKMKEFGLLYFFVILSLYYINIYQLFYFYFIIIFLLERFMIFKLLHRISYKCK